MRKITKYVTDDNKEFDTKEGAAYHEMVKKGSARVDKWLESKGVSLKVSDSAGVDNYHTVINTILSDLKGFNTAVLKKDDAKKRAPQNTQAQKPQNTQAQKPQNTQAQKPQLTQKSKQKKA